MADVTSGWGRLTWGQSDWGDTNVYATGWGAKSWNDGAWGELNDQTVSLTGLSATTTLGNQAWGLGSWGNSGWGDYVLEVADVMGLTGVSLASSDGAPTIRSYNTTTLTGISAASSVGSITPADVMVTEPTDVEADNPEIPIALAGTKAPTALVADKPDRPTECSSSVSKPSEEIKPKFGRVIVAFVETDAKAFTEAVALKPVKPTTSAATTSPKAEDTLKPVNGSTALSTVPHPFCPQFKVPQPGFISVVKVPTLVVADSPVTSTIGVSPHA